MEFAYVNGVRRLPMKGTIGICSGCGGEMISKCGQITVHHWAHRSKIECDLWWESETPWHRDWKDCFPEDFREVVLYNDSKTEFHRADIHTSNGVTIEFQNSPLSIPEVEKREVFYEKLIWVLNAKKFKGFHTSFGIPDPQCPALDGYQITRDVVPKYYANMERFWPKRMKSFRNLSNPHLREITMSTWHDSFIWKNPHKVWLETECPVFFDVGGFFLYLLKRKKQLTEDFLYLKKVRKTDFIRKYSQI
ncbi:competence protein CoiA family protein [Pedobacter sp. P351]|uniref:competence protein CoiA n=1 Tax=Pedobacter superstes TaxID=3133441 RepID=UPI00309CA144